VFLPAYTVDIEGVLISNPLQSAADERAGVKYKPLVIPFAPPV
jgi:hypothetical protein